MPNDAGIRGWMPVGALAAGLAIFGLMVVAAGRGGHEAPGAAQATLPANANAPAANVASPNNGSAPGGNAAQQPQTTGTGQPSQ